MRDQEVLRANKELAAYFKGRRTEREARAALKTIKAFVRDRERLDPSERPPLPGSLTIGTSLPNGAQTPQRVTMRAVTTQRPLKGVGVTDVAAGRLQDSSPDRAADE
jgi:hypothetical protein